MCLVRQLQISNNLWFAEEVVGFNTGYYGVVLISHPVQYCEHLHPAYCFDIAEFAELALVYRVTHTLSKTTENILLSSVCRSYCWI